MNIQEFFNLRASGLAANRALKDQLQRQFGCRRCGEPVEKYDLHTKTAYDKWKLIDDQLRAALNDFTREDREAIEKTIKSELKK